MADTQRFTEATKCGHCQNQAPMEIVVDYSTIVAIDDDRYGGSYDAGAVYELNRCSACSAVTLRSYYWNSAYMASADDVEYTVLYPARERVPRGLPTKIESGYEAAQRVRNVDANAFGVLLGRVLDLVCQDRGATGDTLDKRLQNLADRAEIPAKLVAVAAGLRKLRNVGAHADLGELGEADIPVLDDLTRAILEYVYSAPYLASVAEERLARLQQTRPKKA